VESLLVLDANTGQNGLQQAQQFQEAVPLTGIVVAKLDSSAKGGVLLAIGRSLRIPIKFVGTGEGPEDLHPFDPETFADALFPTPEPSA
jgi:fused signal recognition particle receptor